MGDEPAYPRWGYCFHTGCLVGEYWYCQEEGCRYCGWPVPMEVAGLQADDATGYNGDYLNAGSVAGGENDWNNVAAGYGGGRQGDYQPDNQQGQGLYQDGVQQPETYWHNADEPYNDGEYDGQYEQSDDDQQSDTDHHDADRSGDYHQNDHQRPNPPSDAWATMGSRSSAGQTNSPPSTATLDIDAISMAGNADRDRARWDVVEQTAVHMDTRSYQDIAIQAVGYRYGDTPYQGELYPPELSFSDGPESSVDQSSVERPVQGRR